MKTMTGNIWIGTRCYKPGEEEKLAQALESADAERLAAEGVLAGDWGQSAAQEGALKTLRPATLKALKAANVEPADTMKMTDEQIIDINGIAEASLKEIREVHGEYLPE